MRNFTLFILLSTLCLACQGNQEKKLLGDWQGAVLLEDDMPMDLDPRIISFRFLSNGAYQYKGTLNYRESGTFKVKGDLLYTLDTINKASSEKTVKILNLTQDSLFIKMNADGKQRIVKLVRN